jgi:GntR family transcriptional regulator
MKEELVMTRLQDNMLNLRLDRNSPIPYYIQVKEILQAHIQDGSWPVGDQLPGEAELCQTFAVSRTVIRQALNDLVYKGLLIRRKGKGTFVAGPKIRESLVQKLTGFYQDMVEQGYTPVTQVLKQVLVPATPKIAVYLAVEPGSEIMEIERLRFVEDEPIQFTTTYLPYHLCRDLLYQDLSHQSLYAFLEDHCGLMIAHGRRTVEAVLANDYEARLLRVKKGAPLILLDSVSFLDDGTPVEYYHAIHRGDRTQFEVELIRVREQRTHHEVSDEALGNLSLPGGMVLRTSEHGH